MTVTLGTLLGFTASLGVVLIVIGWRGYPAEERRPPTGASHGRLAWLALGATAFVFGWLISGWPALGLGFTGGVAVLRSAAAQRSIRRRGDAMSEALATWAEMMADVIRSHSALGQAIYETAPATAEVLRPAALALAAEAQTGSLIDALDRFGRTVDHGTADVITAALKIAHQGQGRNLPAVLDKVAEQTRSRTEMLLRIEAGRARIYSEAKTMVGITLALTVLALILGRAYLQPYSSPEGQLVLLMVSGLFVGAGVALVGMGTPAEVPRLGVVERAESSTRLS